MIVIKMMLLFYGWLSLVKRSRSILTVAAYERNCPIVCQCSWIIDNLNINCSNRGLNVYPDFQELAIEYLDLSGNAFTRFPVQLSKYKTLLSLDLSNNYISEIDGNAFVGFTNLRSLNLANNGIRTWLDIIALFRNAISLQYLNLNRNHFISFIRCTNDPEIYIDDINDFYYEMGTLSDSLEELYLENCQMADFNGYYLDTCFPNIRSLTLNDNPIKKLSGIRAQKLHTLEMVNCTLREIDFTSFSIPNLRKLNMSRNPLTRFDDFNASNIQYLDLSECYLNRVNLMESNNLISLELQANNFHHLNMIHLPKGNHLEYFDVSSNFLTIIDATFLNDFKNLRYIDLSYNNLKYLEASTFQYNRILESINLNHNAFEKFSPIISDSLRKLDLSWCSIIEIDMNALNGLSNLRILNLSHNSLQKCPDHLKSATLKQLDLSYGRLTHLDKETFHYIPKLYDLRLNGNLLTQSLTREHFASNPYLRKLSLDDNPWICDCNDMNFRKFYNFLIEPPEKIIQMDNVKCLSPFNLYGVNWVEACENVWLRNESLKDTENNNKGNFWFVIIFIGALIFSFYCIIKCLKKYISYRRKQRDHDEYNRNQRELRNIRRLNRQILTESALPNAPNAPNATNATNMNSSRADFVILPSYEDALKMPKPIRITKSLMDIPKAERFPFQQNYSNDVNSGRICLSLNHKRYRSVEMVMERDQERLAYIEPQRRSKDSYINRSYRNEYKDFAASVLKTQNLQSAEEIANFQSYENSPYTKRKPKIREEGVAPPYKRCVIMQMNSIEFLTDSEIDAQSRRQSPFSQRRPKIREDVISFKSQMDLDHAPQSVHNDNNNDDNNHDNDDRLTPAIENYYSAIKNSSHPDTNNDDDKDDGDDGDDGDDDFHILTQPELHSLKDDTDSSVGSLPDLSLERKIISQKQKQKQKSKLKVKLMGLAEDEDPSVHRVECIGNDETSAVVKEEEEEEEEFIVMIHKP